MAKEQNVFGDTLNLPQTEFPMRAGLPQNEPQWIQRWQQEDIYNKLRLQSADLPKFILHCGPPYANGSMHLGHALTKTIKDMVVRSKQMMGFNAVFVPGWDCHGLPIEWKVERELNAQGKSKNDFSKKEIRALCRAEAAKWIEVQKADWQRFGALGDFEHPYKTMDFQNEADTVRELGKLMNSGLLYKGVKSVMWSTVEETALAEAEVEYTEKESKAIFVAYAVEGKTDEAVVIWTTTPWTMPASKAVAYAAGETYQLIEVTAKNDKATVNVGAKLWLAEALVESTCKLCGIEAYAVVASHQGSAFGGWHVVHPFYGDVLPMLAGDHVTTDAGTGFVHTAPAHGAEDFLLGKEHGLDLHCPVEGNGTYALDVRPLPSTGKALAGNDIWSAQDDIIAEMTARGNLLRWYKIKHSYPISWRSKAPLIFRTTPQWFVSLDQANQGGATVRERCLEEIKKVRWVPGYGEQRITAMVANRPDWCISRQRAWGTPIAIFKNKHSGAFIADPAVFEAVAQQIEKMGIDAWDELPTEQLLPKGWLEAHNLKADDLEKETDILDVWIDSGTTYAHVCQRREDLTYPADMYLEGSDQHRGWFLSSLSMSTAVNGHAPYKQVLTHGFVVDGEGRKMSKSLGNGIEPKQLQEKYGMDIVRLWVASSDYSEDIRISDEILRGTSDAYRRMRNTFRFLLGNLNGFNPETDTVPYPQLPELEQFILAKFAALLAQAKDDYDNYQFHKVYHALHNFCAVELSSLYFDIRKDSLYCDAATDTRRRACQTVLHALLHGLVTHLAPVLAFTADEVWRSYYGAEAESVHLQRFFEPKVAWYNESLLQRWETVLEIRSCIMKAIETLREQKLVGHSLEAGVKLGLSAEEAQQVAGVDWADICIVSEVELVAGSEVQAYAVAAEKCPRCWRRTHEVGQNGQETCNRCADALEKQNGAAA